MLLYGLVRPGGGLGVAGGKEKVPSVPLVKLITLELLSFLNSRLDFALSVSTRFSRCHRLQVEFSSPWPCSRLCADLDWVVRKSRERQKRKHSP